MLSSQKRNRKQREEAKAIAFKAEIRNNSWKCYKSGFSIFIYWSFHIKTGCLGREEWVTKPLGSLQEHPCSCLKTAASGCRFSGSRAMRSLSRAPRGSRCADDSVPTRTASGCQEGHRPGLPGPRRSSLPRASGCASCGETFASVPPRRDLQPRDSPRKTHLPGQLLTVSPPSLKDMFVMRPTAPGHRAAQAELPSLTRETEGPTRWSYIPTEPQRPSPGKAALNAANKHNTTFLIASLKAPSSFCSWGCKFLKLVWSESMIQHENSLFTQSPAVTPRLTVEGEGVWPCSDGDSSLSGLKTCQAASSSPTHVCSTGKTSVLILASTQK